MRKNELGKHETWTEIVWCFWCRADIDSSAGNGCIYANKRHARANRFDGQSDRPEGGNENGQAAGKELYNASGPGEH